MPRGGSFSDSRRGGHGRGSSGGGRGRFRGSPYSGGQQWRREQRESPRARPRGARDRSPVPRDQRRISDYARRASADSSRIPAVSQDAWYLRRALRPFPSPDGNTFYMLGGARSDREILDPAKMSAKLTHLNEEGFNRIGRWLSMCAASFEAGATCVEKYIAPPVETDGEKDALAATGLTPFRAFLESADGLSLVEAMRFLNTSNDLRRDNDLVSRALMPFFQTVLNSRAHANMFQRMASFSAKIYMMSMNMLQAMAVVHDRGHWADELQMQSRAMPAEVREWLSNMDDDTAMLDACTACFNTQVLVEEGDRKRGNVLDSDSDEEEGDEVPEESDEEEEEEEAPRRSTARLSGGGSKNNSLFARDKPDKRRLFDSYQDAPPAKQAKLPFTVTPKRAPAAAKRGDADKEDAETPSSSRRAPPCGSLQQLSLKQLQELSEDLTFDAVQQEGAVVEGAQLARCLALLPLPLRRAQGLPTDLKDFAVLEANVKAIGEKLSQINKDARLAWVAAVSEWLPPATGKITLSTPAAPGEQLQRFYEHAPSFANLPAKDTFDSLLAQRDGEEDKTAVNKSIADLEHAFFKTECMDESEAMHFYDMALTFARTHAKTEPNLTQVKQFLEPISDELRAPYQISTKAKWGKAQQKLKSWRKEIDAAFQFYFVCFQAHVPE